MNGWLLVALLIAVLGLVVLIVCIVAVIVPFKNTVTILLAHVKGIQKQMDGIQVQTESLSATADKMKQDIDYKKQSVQGVVQALKNTGIALNDVNDTTRLLTSKVIRKAQDDPQRQAEVEQWTNTAMGFLKRNS